MLSLIFVPLLCAALIVTLYILLSPGRKTDALTSAQFHIKKAADLSADGGKKSTRDYKKLDAETNRALGAVERAALSDLYDLTLPLAKLRFARDVTHALTLTTRSDADSFLPLVVQSLRAAASYIAAYCGVSLSGEKPISLKRYGKQRRIEQAEEFLSGLDDKQNR